MDELTALELSSLSLSALADGGGKGGRREKPWWEEASAGDARGQLLSMFTSSKLCRGNGRGPWGDQTLAYFY